MADIMEIVRAALAHAGTVEQTEERGKSTPAAPATEPLPPFATFAPPYPWDQQRVSRMTHDADELVGRLGVDGNDPEVQRAAAMVHSAERTRDVETVRYAIAEFVAVVRRIAGTITKPVDCEVVTTPR